MDFSILIKYEPEETYEKTEVDFFSTLNLTKEKRRKLEN